MLPGIDDGAPDEATSLEMARIAVADGITTTACTPHIYPGLYENDAAGIKVGIVKLQRRLFDEGIALKLTIGADAHLTPELLGRLRAGTAPSLAGGRYFLLEPPHTIATRCSPGSTGQDYQYLMMIGMNCRRRRPQGRYQVTVSLSSTAYLAVACTR